MAAGFCKPLELLAQDLRGDAMSLLSSAFEPCVILDKKTVSDGQGGYSAEWTEGAKIDCAFSLDTSTAARVAQHNGVKNLYTIITRKSVTLDYNDVLRREKDGKTFRVTSDGADKATPDAATLSVRQVSAEEWSVPR